MTEKEDLKEFKQKFNEYFHRRVVPSLGIFENERKKAIMIILAAFAASVILSALILLILVNTHHGDSIGFSFIPMFIFFIFFICKKMMYESKIKEKVMPVLVGAFGDFHWTTDQLISDSEIRSSLLINQSYDDRTDDDCFYGTYRGIKLVINETDLAYETRDSKGNRRKISVFDGLLIELDMNKNFNGHTIIIKDSMLKFDVKSLKRVTLEDPVFEKFFDVFSTDQIEARYLLTTAFMERFKNLILVFKTKAIKCSFKDGKVLFALDVRKDMFLIGSLFRPATDTKQYEELFTQISSIFEMILVLKLDMKIGM